MIEYEQRQNETWNAWMSRLCTGKNDKSIKLGWEQINIILGNRISTDHLRKLAKGMTMSADTKEPRGAESVIVERNKDGTITDERIISLKPDELSDDKSVMRAHFYDPDLWEVVSSRHSIWQAHTKQGPTKTLYASKITVKLRTSNFDPKKIIEDALKFYTPPEYVPHNYSRNGKLLIVTIPDLHLNAFSWRGDVGVDYDMKIAKACAEEFTRDVVQHIGQSQFEKIIISPLGDFFHIDNTTSSTTKGTPQDTDTRHSKMMSVAHAVAMMMIESFAQLAPTEWIHIPGNHDVIMSFDMAFTLFQMYKYKKDAKYPIVINADPIARKAIEYGVNLIGLMHGEMPRKTSSSWLSNEHREAYGRTKHAIIYAGHLHERIEPYQDGVQVMFLPTMKPVGKWEYDMGYMWSQRQSKCFVWDKFTGPSEEWTTNIKEGV